MGSNRIKVRRSDRRRFRREPEAQFPARAPNADRARSVPRLEPLRRSIEGWPAARLTVPNRRRDYALPPTAYPASFAADVEAYLAHLASDDLFAETGRARLRVPTTLRDVRLRLFQMAAALVLFRAGPRDDPLARRPGGAGGVKTAFSFLYSRNGKRKTGQLHNFALTAIKIAKYWVKAPPDQIEALQAIRREVDPKSNGHDCAQSRPAAPVRRSRESSAASSSCRKQSCARCHDRRRPSYAEAIKLQSAAGDRDSADRADAGEEPRLASSRPTCGPDPAREASRHIVIPAEEVKNRTALAFELLRHPSARSWTSISARCRPILVDGGPDGYLFPARKGGAKTPAQLAEQIKQTIAQETGIDLNAHAFRHLSAMLFWPRIQANTRPCGSSLATRVSRRRSKPIVGLEQADALRRLDALIDRHRSSFRAHHDRPSSPAH